MKQFLFKFLILLCFFAPALKTNGQTNILDSLVNQLSKSKADTNQFNLLNLIIDNSQEGTSWIKYNDQIGSLSLKLISSPNHSIARCALKNRAIFLKNRGYIFDYNDGNYSAALPEYFESLKIFNTINDLNSVASLHNSIGMVYFEQGNFIRAEKFLRIAFTKYQKAKNTFESARILNNLGGLYRRKGLIDKAFQSFEKAKDICASINEHHLAAASTHSMGEIYALKGDLRKAIELYTQVAKFYSLDDDSVGLPNTYVSIAVTYKNIQEFETSIKYNEKALEIYTKTKNIAGQGLVLNNLGAMYFTQKNYSLAISFFRKSYAFRKLMNNKNDIGESLNNLGSVLVRSGKYDTTLVVLHQALIAVENSGDIKKLIITKTNLSHVHFLLGDSKKALTIANEVTNILGSKPFKVERMNLSLLLYKIHKKLGSSQEALKNYSNYIFWKDSLFSIENKNNLVKQQYKFEYDKKAAADSIKTGEEKKIVVAKLMQEKTQRYTLYGGLILVIVFAIFIFNRIRLTQKQKSIIEQQKEIVEEKQKEVLDSIKYAKRLQNAILPSLMDVQLSFENSFILFKPKDIVAGDFYWMHKSIKYTFIAVADCTGHGVPGALVSVVCSNALNRAVKEFGIDDPGQILDKVRELVIETFEKSDKDVKDGMDISLARFENENKTFLAWAGANNPLWIVQESALTEIKANKQPIGKHLEQRAFTTHIVKLEKNENVYLITDGYADQFGGPKGKKYKYKQLEEKLISVYNKSALEQKNVLENEFEEWKNSSNISGNSQILEQVDDVCIIGILNSKR